MAGFQNASSAIIPNNSQIYGKFPKPAQKVHEFVPIIHEFSITRILEYSKNDV